MKHFGTHTFCDCHRLIGTIVIHNNDFYCKITTLQTLADIAFFIASQQVSSAMTFFQGKRNETFPERFTIVS